jgi:uncharacterized protein YjbJ (UPF0337 family)
MPVAHNIWRAAASKSGSRDRITLEEQHMADDMDREGLENQVKGTGKQAEGRIRNSVGGLTGDTSEQIRGKAQELKGKAQRRIGEAEVDSDSDV